MGCGVGAWVGGGGKGQCYYSDGGLSVSKVYVTNSCQRKEDVQHIVYVKISKGKMRRSARCTFGRRYIP